MEKAIEVVPSATAFVDYFLDISGILTADRGQKNKSGEEKLWSY